jgi:hypothetical protein
MMALGLLALIVGFISDTLTDLFDHLAKPANNMLVLLLVLFGGYAIREKAKALHSQLSALGGKIDALGRRLDKVEERALRSDETASLALLEKELRRQSVLETGAKPDVAEAIANDPALAEAVVSSTGPSLSHLVQTVKQRPPDWKAERSHFGALMATSAPPF